MTYEKCKTSVSATLKKRGFDDPSELAAGMCSMWATENGVERQFAADGMPTEPVRRTFGISLGEEPKITFNSEEGVDSVTFPVIAITSGLHTYEEESKEEKVYIEPTILKSNIEAFKELPIYLNHQRTPEDLIGMATEPQLIQMENGKSAVQMMATVDNKTGHGQEVLNKVKDGDMTHVSIDWFSNDIDVMGDTYATQLRPTEVSFIDNEKMDPVCKECTIGKECDSHATHDDHDCGCGGHETACECKDGPKEEETMKEEDSKKSDAENIVEREFASLRGQLEEAQASNAEMKSQYDEALKTIEAFKATEEKRAAKEAKARKLETIEAIISKEVIFGTVKEESKETRVEELSAWDEPRLTGFSDALAAMPLPEETERQFGKGKTQTEESAVEETERKFAVEMNKDGKIRLNKELLRGN
jgi:hypothetical protein|tara:strand:+ start:4034 stop:5287 length:1254 start_codon:yes stop_codon:yes gene_type:complete